MQVQLAGLEPVGLGSGFVSPISSHCEPLGTGALCFGSCSGPRAPASVYDLILTTFACMVKAGGGRLLYKRARTYESLKYARPCQMNILHGSQWRAQWRFLEGWQWDQYGRPSTNVHARSQLQQTVFNPALAKNHFRLLHGKDSAEEPDDTQ